MFLAQCEALALQGKEDDREVALACYACVLLDSKLIASWTVKSALSWSAQIPQQGIHNW